jgi:hypothetical protein
VDRDRADAHVTKVDVPAFIGSVGRTSGGHALLKRGPISLYSTDRSEMTAPSHAATFDMIRQARSITVPRVRP